MHFDEHKPYFMTTIIKDGSRNDEMWIFNHCIRDKANLETDSRRDDDGRFFKPHEFIKDSFVVTDFYGKRQEIEWPGKGYPLSYIGEDTEHWYKRIEKYHEKRFNKINEKLNIELPYKIVDINLIQ